MMTNPSVNSLLEKVNDRFTLCIIAGKRALQLIDGSQKLTAVDSDKPVTIATNELMEDKFTFIRTEGSPK